MNSFHPESFYGNWILIRCQMFCCKYHTYNGVPPLAMYLGDSQVCSRMKNSYPLWRKVMEKCRNKEDKRGRIELCLMCVGFIMLGCWLACLDSFSHYIGVNCPHFLHILCTKVKKRYPLQMWCVRCGGNWPKYNVKMNSCLLANNPTL
jgi:hypothetical protein